MGVDTDHGMGLVLLLVTQLLGHCPSPTGLRKLRVQGGSLGEVEHLADKWFGKLLLGHDENESGNPHNKFIKGNGFVGPRTTLSAGPKAHLDSADDVVVTGDGGDDDTQPVGILVLPIVLEKADVPHLEVLVSLGIL